MIDGNRLTTGAFILAVAALLAPSAWACDVLAGCSLLLSAVFVVAVLTGRCR